ncbi:MAG: hypothetical protein U5R06_21440 [candidate division KSB1 bacterium]|nr:hypothetical protein [candidate division KSB1 bacterium]
MMKKAAIELRHIQGIDNQSIFQIPDLQTDESVFKVKKFACKALKGKGSRSGLRVIYSFDKRTHHVHFIEIYYKGDKANEDIARIKRYIKE